MTANRRLGAGALYLAGMSARLLGWRPDEFWRATPAELAACLAPSEPIVAARAAPSRAEIAALMERDHDRSD